MVVVHMGTNDIQQQQLEILKQDFIQLSDILKQSKVKTFISRPVPTLGWGMGWFTRLLSLYTWLSMACQKHDAVFIDNFNLLWQRRDCFRHDGLHLNFDFDLYDSVSSLNQFLSLNSCV